MARQHVLTGVGLTPKLARTTSRHPNILPWAVEVAILLASSDLIYEELHIVDIYMAVELYHLQ